MRKDNGFTGVDIAVSVVILIIFVSVIGTMFYNLSVTERRIQRKTEATNTAIRTIEAMKAIPFDQLAEGMTLEDINNLSTNKIEVPNGYKVTVGVDNTTYKDVVKIISVNIDYQNGNQAENVNIETLVRNLSTVGEELKGIFVALNGSTLGFFDTEQKARAYADSDTHYFGNVQGQNYENASDVPWSSATSLVKSSQFFDTVTPTSTQNWFANCINLTQIVDSKNLNTSQDTNMRNMFVFCNNLSTIDVSTWNTSKVTNMSGMFAYCNKLNNLDLSSFNTSNVTDMTSMFLSCSNLEKLDLTSFNTSKVTGMAAMFADCSSLTSLNVSSFNTSKVTNMQQMFARTSLSNISLTSFDTSNVTDMSGMFDNNSNLSSVNVSSFNTSKVKAMQGMFALCSKLTELDLSSFDTSNVTHFSYEKINGNYWWGIFHGCTNLKSLDISNFDFINTKYASDIFKYMPSKSSGTKIYVKDATARNFILSTSNVPSDWDSSNIIVK